MKITDIIISAKQKNVSAQSHLGGDSDLTVDKILYKIIKQTHFQINTEIVKETQNQCFAITSSGSAYEPD